MSHQQHSRQPSSSSSTATMHQLSSGLLVSGPPDPSAAPSHHRSFLSASPSSSRSLSLSGPTSRIPPTGLITSAPPPPVHHPAVATDKENKRKKEKEHRVSSVGPERELGFRFGIPRAWAWAGAGLLMVALAAGVLVWIMLRKFLILAAAAGIFVLAAAALGVWNWLTGRRELERFLRGLDDASVDPRSLPVGKMVKVTGLVTCGAAPLETSYQNIPRCVYASTELYEYRGWNGLPVNSKHRRFTWGLRYSERHVSDFYISDINSGMRFLVRAGGGARVVSFVKPATIVDMTQKNRELTPNFISWLTDHDLSSNDRVLRLEEGFIKEGGIASVMGILRKHENLIIIDQPRDVISTGCQWKRCFFPMYVDGLVLIGDTTPEAEVCHV
ncbi:putative membrane protein-like [Iris pallida]|uniref:Membrane protein-like n=1 Tax=Iris pallida TaxID=29817 RepID=A0AAX6GKL6_IRIPA|nr:putative membrane protein-like [Iris pallida]KAJ6829072.1 putative membrane protein-like [Iris pallida]